MNKDYGEIINQLLLYTPKEDVVKMYIELLKNNDKAIEYIEDRLQITSDGDYALIHTFDKCNVKELYEILRGNSND